MIGAEFWNKKLQYCDGVDELWLDGTVEKEAVREVLPEWLWQEQRARDLVRGVYGEQRMGEEG